MERHLSVRAALLVSAALSFLGPSLSTLAVPLLNDPDGFEGFAWGSILSEREQFVKIEESGRLQAYELNGRIPSLSATPVDSLRFTTFEKKLGRATVRYTGKERHEEILVYLESKYGPLDRTPGQIPVGSVKVYTWHGVYTEVTLRFEVGFERGIIFFESRTLPEKLMDGTSTTAF
jgi:hypothetical protein